MGERPVVAEVLEPCDGGLELLAQPIRLGGVAEQEQRQALDLGRELDGSVTVARGPGERLREHALRPGEVARDAQRDAEPDE